MLHQSAFCILNKSLTTVTFWVGFVLMQKPAFFIILTKFEPAVIPLCYQTVCQFSNCNPVSQVTSEEVTVLGNADKLLLQQSKTEHQRKKILTLVAGCLACTSSLTDSVLHCTAGVMTVLRIHVYTGYTSTTINMGTDTSSQASLLYYLIHTL